MSLESKRILAALIDVLVLPFILFALIIIEGVLGKYIRINFDIIFSSFEFLIPIYIFFKDALNISIGKKIFKLRIKSDRKERDWRLPEDWPKGKPMWQQLFLRNLTVLIWPIEIIMILVSDKRLGDKLAHTYVEQL